MPSRRRQYAGAAREGASAPSRRADSLTLSRRSAGTAVEHIAQSLKEVVDRVAAGAAPPRPGIADESFAGGLELVVDAIGVVENPVDVRVDARRAPIALNVDRHAKAGGIAGIARGLIGH